MKRIYVQPRHEISSTVVCATSKGSDHTAHTSLEYYMTVKLLTERHLEFLSLKGGCTCLSESIHVKMPHCRSSILILLYDRLFLLTAGLRFPCDKKMD